MLLILKGKMADGIVSVWLSRIQFFKPMDIYEIWHENLIPTGHPNLSNLFLFTKMVTT
jgi:hypothetical protein